MQVVLVMFRGDGERKSFSIARDITIIGRREDCDLRIPVSDVSRKHCRLLMDDQTIKIEDLGSSNGTYINGQRVRESALNAGDRVRVGPVTFVVQIDGVPAEDEMTPTAPAQASDDDELEALLMGEDAEGASPSKTTPGQRNATHNSDSIAEENAEAERLMKQRAARPPDPDFEITVDDTPGEVEDDLVDFEVNKTTDPDHSNPGQ